MAPNPAATRLLGCFPVRRLLYPSRFDRLLRRRRNDESRSLAVAARQQPQLALRVRQEMRAVLLDHSLLFQADHPITRHVETHLNRENIVRLDHDIGAVTISLPTRPERAGAVVRDPADVMSKGESRLRISGIDDRAPRFGIDLMTGAARLEHGHARVNRGSRRLESLCHRLRRAPPAVLSPVTRLLEGGGQ